MVNFCLDEYCNIGYMEGASDVFNSIRGFNMSCQIVVQSLSQWAEKYPGKDWENQLNTFDMTLYMGCNDLTSAKYIAEKCGKVTIAVTNNQMPLMPLFSPVYSSTRPYSQTKSNTQRDLMQYDEVLRLAPDRCIALFNHRKPALLYKLSPEELPGYSDLKPCRVLNYTPEWKRREEAAARKCRRQQAQAQKAVGQTVTDLPTAADGYGPVQQDQNRTPKQQAADSFPAIPDYELAELTGGADSGIGMVPMSQVLGEDDETDDTAI